MHNLKFLQGRFIFVVGGVMLLVSIATSLLTKNNLLDERNKSIIGNIESYISYIDSNQKFIVLNNEDKLRYLVITKRDYKVEKGECIKCAGNFVSSNSVYFKSKNVVGTIYNCDNLEVVNKASIFDSFLNNVRSYVESFAHRNLKEPDASLVMQKTFLKSLENLLLYLGQCILLLYLVSMLVSLS